MAAPYIYVAGPLFTPYERDYIEKIATALEGKGYRTFVPHRDVGLSDGFSELSEEERFRTIYHGDHGAMEACDFCVALLDGSDEDGGTSVEIGYMAGKGKLVYGLRDDIRGPVGIMAWGVCGEGKRMARSIDELVTLVTTFSPIQ